MWEKIVIANYKDFNNFTDKTTKNDSESKQSLQIGKYFRVEIVDFEREQMLNTFW